MSLPNTHFGPDAIAGMLEKGKKLFFLGIGGVSMNSLAHLSHERGFDVAGYDRTPSSITEKLENNGITVYYYSDASHVENCAAVVYTNAMSADNPEYIRARELGIPCVSRADFLGYLMMDYRRRIGVAGTHGKSTTTGLLDSVFRFAGVESTVMGGAPMKDTGMCDRLGGKEYYAFEACEYMDSFLNFRPTTAILLNVELDHVDYFPDIDALSASCCRFLNLAGDDGYAVVNADDPGTARLRDGIKTNVVTFGRKNPADYSSANEEIRGGFASFDVMHDGKKLARVRLSIPGEHNISNALAAFAACSLNGIGPEEIAGGLSRFSGIGRRMEKIGETARGALIYTDYAHHPSEIRATLKAAGAMKGTKRLRVVFQPHTYSRTAALFDDFTAAFADSAVDEVLLCDIYAAREINTYGVSSADLAGAVAKLGKPAFAAADFEEAADRLAADSEEGDMIIVMGAGDVVKISNMLVGRGGDKQ